MPEAVDDFTITLPVKADQTIEGAKLANNQVGDLTIQIRIKDTSSLGSHGQLINGVQVEGKWYFAWDRNGDGGHGVDARNSTSDLDRIFITNLSALAQANGLVGSFSESNREFILNGVRLRLPTDGNPSSTDHWQGSGGDFQIYDPTNPGAYIGNRGHYFPKNTSATGQGSANNPSYDDLMAICEAFSEDGEFKNCIAPGWSTKR